MKNMVVEFYSPDGALCQIVCSNESEFKKAKSEARKAGSHFRTKRIKNGNGNGNNGNRNGCKRKTLHPIKHNAAIR